MTYDDLERMSFARWADEPREKPPSIALQQRADDLALRLAGEDRLLVWELRSAISGLEERLARVRYTLENG